MKALAPSTLVALAVANGATTPVPSGGAGSLIWSSTANAPLVWDGSQWATCAAPGAGSGDVVGPASATDNALARFDGTSGKTVQSSLARMDDDGNIGIGGDPIWSGGGWSTLTVGGTAAGGKSGLFYARAGDGTINAQILAGGTYAQMGLRVAGDTALDFYLHSQASGNYLYSATRGLVFHIGGAQRAGYTPAGNLILYAPDSGSPLTVLGPIQIGDYVDTSLERVAAGRLAVEGAGLVRGPAGATDNAIVRFDAATGDLTQDSRATISDDGIIRSATNGGANPVGVPLVNWVMQTADYALTSTTSEQKAFNTTANGRLTLPSGVYVFECLLFADSMGLTSGNFAFDPIGAGTAVVDRFGFDTVGLDGNQANTTGGAAVAVTGSGHVIQQTGASAVAAQTSPCARQKHRGMFRVSTGGTIIPSVTLVTAYGARILAGSYFIIEKVGESSETSLGAWD